MISTKIRGYKIFAPQDRKELIESLANAKNVLVALNAEKLLKVDTRLKAIVNKNIGYPDGVGAVLALKRKGISAVKIPGVELWLDIVNRYHMEKSFYLVGSSQEVVTTTVNLLRQNFPKIDIKNYRNGYMSGEDFDDLKKDIQKKQPSMIFVAMGTPRQEFLMEELMKAHPALYMGLGGSFDIYSGLKKRAPSSFRKLYLEWLYRLLKEPTRIKRQLALWKFLFLLTLNKI